MPDRTLQTPVTVADCLHFIDLIRGEAMELVETAPEQYRSAFGAGMTHGFLKAANRFKTLLDEHLNEAERREEAFEKEF